MADRAADGRAGLEGRLAELERANAEVRAARRAALNVMEDAVQVRDALRASEERNRLALDAAGLGSFVWHPQEDRGEPDARMLALFGLPAGGRLNLADALAGLIHPADRERYAAAVGRAIDPAGDGGLQEDIRIVRPDGVERWVAITARTEFTGQPRRAVRMPGVAADITDRKRAEERQAFLLRLSDALRPPADARDIKAAAAAALGGWLDVASAGYAETEPDGLAAVITDEHNDGRIPSLKARYTLKDFSSVTEPMRRGETISFADLDDGGVSPDTRAAFAAINVRAAVAAPLIKNGFMVGYFFVAHPEPRVWTTGDLEILQEVAERTWAAVERARAEAALRDRDEQLSLAQRAARLGVSSLDLATGVGNTTPEWREVVGFPGPPAAQDFATFLALVHPDDRDRVAALHDPPADHLDYEYRVDHPRLGERWLLSRAVRLPAADGGPGRLVGLAMDVTDRKRAEDAVRESEARFRGLAETVPQLVWTSDDTAIEYFNPQWYAYTGRDPAAGPGADWAEVVHPDDRAETARRVEEVLRTGEAYENEYRLRRADGEYRWHLARAVRTPDGRWIGVATDVHDLRRATEGLRAGETRFRAVAENLPNAAVFVVDRDLRYTLAAGEGLAAAGFAPADFEGRLVREAVEPEQVGPFEANYRRALGGDSFSWEHAVRDRHFASRGVPLRDPAGGVTAALAVSYDITDRVGAEGRLRESEERFRMLVENATDHAIFGMGPGGVVGSWNAGAERVFGYPEAEAVGRRFHDFFTPEDRAAGLPQRELATALAGGRAADDNWAVRRDGTRFWATGATYAVRDGAGRPTGFVKVVRDRTEPRAAEEAVRQAEGQLRQALTAARMGLWWWDVTADTHVRDANLNRMLGLPPARTRQPFAEFLGRVHPDDRAAVRGAFDRAVLEGRELATEFRVVWPDGTVRWLRDQGDVFGQPDDGTLRLTGACVDVTERKEADEALRKARDELEARVAERTAELSAAYAALEEQFALRRDLARRMATASEEQRGRISRELHDELGQLLTGLGLGLKALEGRTADPAALGRLQELAGRIGREAHRIALELRPTALDDLGLVAAVRNYAEEWAARAGVAVDLHLPDPAERLPAEVETAAYRIVQEALTNVVKHAAATRVSVMVERRPGQLAAIVEDDGRGFEPGEVLDPRRPGDPLGLAGMRERAALVGGRVEVESSPGGGTTVYARFPLPPAPPAGPG
jgi:PAS domain S-box-containing protein